MKIKPLKFLPLIGIALFIYIVYNTGLSNIISTLKGGKLVYIAVSAIFPLLFICLQSIKWNLLLKSQKINLDFLYTLRIQFISGFLGLVTPARIGSFSKIFYLKKRIKGSLGEASSSVITERAMDLLVIFILALIGSLILIKKFSNIFSVIVISFALLLFGLFIFSNKKRCAFIFRWIHGHIIPKKYKDYAKDSFHAFYDSLIKPRKAVLPFLISIIAWISIYTQAFLVAAAFDVNINYFVFITLFPIATIIGLIPITVGGFGTREATIIAIFGTFGISATALVAISLVWSLTAIFESFIGGLIAWKLVNKEIERHLKIICNVILSEIPNVRSIVLTGGFSRGEGPVKVKDKKIFPYNDYDIEVITDKPINGKVIDEVAIKAAKKIGLRGIEYFYSFKKEEQTLDHFFYVDLKCISIKQLKKLMPRLRYYELKNSSKVLYGEDLRRLIPEYKISDIPFSEPAKILLDRMSQMMEYYSTEKKYDEEVLTYFIQQAYAACCTALLMLSRRYKPGYEYCMKTFFKSYKKDFPELYEKVPKLHYHIKKFITWKIKPDKLPADSEKAWFECQREIFEVAKYFFSKFLNKKIKSLDNLSKAIKNMSKEYYLPYMRAFLKNKFEIKSNLINGIALALLPWFFKLKYYLRLKEMKITYPRVFFNKSSPDLIIFASVPYLLLAINKDKIVNKEKLKKGINLLKKVYPVKGKNWEEISLDYANAYISFFLQKII